MPNDEIRAEFARRLRMLMDARGLNAKSLLWAMDDTPENTTKVYGWLSGDRTPSYESLLKLHRVLRCSWRELMGE